MPGPSLISSVWQISRELRQEERGAHHPQVLPLPEELSSVRGNTQAAVRLPFGDPSIIVSIRETKASKEGSPTAPKPSALSRLPF